MSRVDRRGAGEREREIAGVAAEALTEASGRLLVVGDVTGTVAPAGGVVWNRCTVAGCPAVAWPEGDAFDGAVVRLPGGWPSFEMALHAVAARLSPGAPLWIYGAGDEGITSAAKRLSDLFADPETVSIKRRSRVLKATRTAAAAKGGLADWRQVEEDGWVSYPGLFANGRVDAGTELLLSVLPEIRAEARVLDFACGAGRIAAAVRARTASARLTLLDNDAVALVAAAENVSGAATILNDGWTGLAPRRDYDLILSNPPIHAGRSEDFEVLARLVEDAPLRLAPRGSLIAVVQRTVGAGRLFAAAFRNVEKLAETPQYQVWRGAV